jgi:hypothetical protein
MKPKGEWLRAECLLAWGGRRETEEEQQKAMVGALLLGSALEAMWRQGGSG